MRVLIVDDDDLVVKLLGQVCRAEGHDTRTCTSAELALELLFEHPIDMLITDLRMPGLDGMTLARHARRLQPGVFTLIITGHAREFSIEDVMKEDKTDLMFKPFHMNELRARVALADNHKKAIDALDDERRKIHAQNTETIQSLHIELNELRRPKTA